jgi:hypothetical protein
VAECKRETGNVFKFVQILFRKPALCLGVDRLTTNQKAETMSRNFNRLDHLISVGVHKVST